MSNTRNRPNLGNVVFFGIAFTLASYFLIAAIQGDYGVFQRVQIEAEKELLMAELAALTAEVEAIENKTHRLSDAYLDVDLLDQQAREILGLVRSDEIVIR
ncbi:MAG: septum formation initiator family protein [Pseudoruegeria sp.]